MSEANLKSQESTVYRVQGFSCAGCAKTFEKNVKQLSGVSDAQVNFGASKVTVVGNATVEDLERAGAFENLKILPEKSKQVIPKEPFLKKYSVLFVSVAFIVLGYLSQNVYGEDNISTILAFLMAILIGGYSLFKVGLMNLIRLQFDMKTLMTVAIIGASIIGEWSEGAIVVILFAISEALERYSMDKARQSIRSLMDIAPQEALVLRNGNEITVHVDEIQVGDIMIVKPGQKIAMDGVVVKGYSSINQAAITGESVPVEKNVSDEVFAGTLNGEGLLEVKVTKLVDDTTIAKIIHLVEEAQAERAPSQAFVDRFAKYYTPAIMIIAALVAIIPPLLFNGSWEDWVYQGLAVLVVGCPCALVVSTPVSIVTAIGNAARNGVLIKGGIHLEEAGSLKAIAFDKTGTLTKGTPVVTDYKILLNNDPNELLGIIAALESRSQHPLASAIIQKAVNDDISYKEIEVVDFSSITGKGIKGRINGMDFYIGSPKLFVETLSSFDIAGIDSEIKDLQLQGKTVMVIGADQKILALLAVADEVRESSKDVIRKLHTLGLKKTIMLTGDNQGTANEIGRQVGVSEIKAELMPEDKLKFIKEMRYEYEKVAMVGDGVNDAPALASATVGIAMGGAGTDTALETADIALMGDDLSKLPFTIKLSRQALWIIKQNITFSIVIKLLALILVIPGWLTLWIAIFADMGATLLVTINSLRLLKVKE
ncbi:heavy metal translocating P-type ATPase [Peribacillus acanthi]|uniref:heavy metal translocating P-type ATPase n=1 Tax=Peribacillus acanthi TaxID=2171554 RepID=UPI000D3EB7E4|nr:heavy metal translocating P-type ATPase [Peribacillus acanthi]